jgi:tetratricopeptide (TPR) repeat protein
LQTQKQFDDAKAKLDLAISTDPQPLATSGPAAQAKAAQAKLYIQWGDDFLAKKDFAGAIDHYRTAITLSESKDQPAAKDAVANAYLQWAASLRDTEDYLGALQQIEEAGKNTGTGAAVKLVESAKTDTYTAFSKSSGTQAQKAMKDAIKAVCAGTKPDLPIFGLDKYNVRAALAGTDYSLPDNVLAKTPDALHYVACIVIETVKVEKRDIPIWTGSGWTNGQMVREKNNWHVTLYRVDNAALVQKTDIAGGNPPPLPAITRSNYISIFTGGIYQRYKGSDPDVVELANWMLGVMK